MTLPDAPTPNRNQTSAGVAAAPCEIQYTQGMPYLAFALTVTEAPFVVVYDGVEAAAGEDEAAVAVGFAPPRATGSAVVARPRMTCTCPAATELPGVAVTPRSLAIRAA